MSIRLYNRVSPTLVTLAAIMILPVTIARADFTTDLATATRPVEDGVPEVAVVRLEVLLKTNLKPDQRRLVLQNLVQAMVEAKRPADAIPLIKQNDLSRTPLEKFWHAQALAALGQWQEALVLYETVAGEKSFPRRSEAAFAAAEMLRALGRPDEAIRKLTPSLTDKKWRTRAALHLAALYLDKADLPNAQRVLHRIDQETPAERKQHRFLRGRLELAQNHPDRALGYLEPLVKKPREVVHPLMIAALCLIADIHVQLKTPEAGDDFLEQFIEHHPMDTALPQLFAKLDELYRAEKKPVRADLERWTREPQQPRRGLAQWYLARIESRGGRKDRAHQLLSDLRTSRANLPELAGGLVELAEMEMRDGNFNETIAIAEEARAWRPPPELRARFEFLAARANYAAGRYQAATTGFEQLGRNRSGFTVPALYNASLGWLQLGDRSRFSRAFDAAQAAGVTPDDRAELRLQEGLLKARQQQPDAADVLRKFLTDFPQNPRASEALVALAELAFHRDPPRIDEARKLLARAEESHPTPAAKERGHYLMIWIEDAVAANGDQVIDLAKRFLSEQPGSEFTGDVRMKLAEAYYLRQDFSNAQTQFEVFARENPDSPLAEKALFFAGESAMGSMAPHTLDHALTLFEQVAQMKGDLRWAARNEQALIERKLGKPQDALLLYEDVLKNDARPGEKREALCGKGDIYFELSASDPKNYERAIQAYDELAGNAAEAGHWHNQALFKKGVCLEKKADAGGALATFYRVLESPGRPARAPELFWFYKAGFNAARLLETAGNWESAAKVYQKLVATGGSRSEEARLRLNQLRLEHFLWSE
ncbi:MAG TPA: tetratricopeptide repeat protein [Chthoniobacterales bacterium]|nr:tetratricopeptide repeat protein [Chthoniobacterales bacterium]